MHERADAVLINPRNPGSAAAFTSENLALAYLSAALAQHGARVRIIDCDLEGLSPEAIAGDIARQRPVLAGITALARSADAAVEIARAIHRAAPGVPVVVGGLHFSYCAEPLLSNVREIEFVIRGEGERALVQLFDAMRSCRPGALRGVGNLTYREGCAIRSNACVPAVADLDTLPRPDRQVLARAVSLGLRPAVPILGSRGCYGQCLFCNASSFYVGGGGRPWRGRPPASVVDEMETLVREHADRVDPVLLFYDDTFIGPGPRGRARARAFAEEILRRGLKVRFEVFLRADAVADDDELVALLRRAGMVRVFMGIEASDDAELRRLRKGIDVAMVRRAVARLQRHGVTAPASGFIMFEPHSTWSSLRRNALFLHELGHASIWNLSTRLDVYAGNGFEALLRADGLVSGATCQGGYFTYEFRDPQVGAFARYMDLAQHPVVQRLDASGRFIEFDHASLVYEARRMGIADGEGGDVVSRALRDIQERSYGFFVASLDSFERGESDGHGERERFLADLAGLTDRLEAAHDDFLREMGRRVAHA
jgi:hypothetical protein